MGVPIAESLFSAQEERELLDMARRGEINIAELADKLSLICAESDLYDLQATTEALLTIAPHRTIMVNTSLCEPEEVARQVIDFVERVSPCSRNFERKIDS
jgi:hypothetical protein